MSNNISEVVPSDLAQFFAGTCQHQGLTPSDYSTLAVYFEPVDFGPRQLIAEIDELGDALFYIAEGEAVLYHDDGYKEIEIARVEQGELMGEMSFFDRHPRMVRIRAGKKGAHGYQLTRAQYEKLRDEFPHIAARFLECVLISLDHVFRRTTSHVATVTQYVYGVFGPTGRNLDKERECRPVGNALRR